MDFESPQPVMVSQWASSNPDGPNPEVRLPRREARPFPAATIVIVALCVVMFVFQTLAGGSQNTNVLIDFGASYKPYFQDGQYWRAVMPLFLHIGLWHLAVNMFSLLMIGPVLERMYGYGRYALIYVVAGIGGCLLSMFYGHALAAGASGAIFGVAGAIVVARWAHPDAVPHELERIFRRGRFTAVLLVFIVIELVAGRMVSNIDNWGHLGGLLGGAALAFLIPPLKRDQAFAGPFSGHFAEGSAPGSTPASTPSSAPASTVIDRGAGWGPAAQDRPAHAAFQAVVLVPVALVALSMAAAARHYRVASQLSRLLSEGQRLESAHQPGQAFDRYQRARQLDTRDERPVVALGQLELTQHDPARAIAEFQQALKLDPDSIQARFGLAVAYQANGNTAEAEKAFEALASLDPRAADVQEAVADLLAEQKLYARAVERYEAVLRLSPNSPIAHNNLAWLYATAEDPKFQNPAAALDHARKAVELSRWRAPEYIDTLAEALYANRQYAEAVKVQTRALALDPNNHEFQQHMARYRSAAGG
ncbi:MAG TPA: rhomboid family intramembrane serine protease [Terriglobia bacterium]|nr:rhomboid family intramembrane serine protease [Terriglobia bacterium]